jgi:ring-1,2-phenylacetyl-CoA epoxidase subunit PaaD
VITPEQVRDILRTIDDPEMPVSIVDLGLVEDVRVIDSPPEGARVEVDLLPTFVGCPALDMISSLVSERIGGQPGVGAVDVRWLNSPPWSVERISDAGRERLRKFGVTTPERGTCGAGRAAAGTIPQITPLTIGGVLPAVRCPYCNSENTTRESPFGPTRCRMMYYCEACRNSFEHLKPV